MIFLLKLLYVSEESKRMFYLFERLDMRFNTQISLERSFCWKYFAENIARKLSLIHAVQFLAT